MTDKWRTTYWTYDELNRTTGRSDPLFGATSYAYDGMSSRTMLAYPGGTSLYYAYDAVDRMAAVAGGGGGRERTESKSANEQMSKAADGQ